MSTTSDVELTELTNGSDGSDSESDDLSTTPEPAQPSILERLQAPQQSDLARKRTNPSRGKRRSRGSSASSSDPKGVRPEQRIKDYPGETFIVSCGNLFCRACRERLCLKKSSVKNHVGSKKHLEGNIAGGKGARYCYSTEDVQ